ncbi:zinc-ribbon domain-containing protein [Nocardioides sp. MAHUQ-72]|uniref:zinc-ribbon domain-containing protein n=1 Tax=unclassified Nocardioides TaxID=2615069 RepID=UPI003606429B
MPTCAHCGSENPETSRFCGGCGRPLGSDTPTAPLQAAPVMPPAAPPATPPAAPPTAPMAAPPTAPPSAPPVLPPPPTGTPYAAPQGGPQARPQGSTSPSLPSVDWQRILVGNWLGAGLTAATALGVAGVLSTVLALMSKPEDFGVDNGLTLVATLLAATFGADLVLDLDFGGEKASAHLGMFPLTVTILALVAAALVFRRVTRRYQRVSDAIGDAARAALLLGLAVMVFAIVFRGDNDKLGGGWGSELSSRQLGFDASWGPSIAGAFFLSFVMLLATLVAVLYASRRDWWPASVQRVHDWTAAPLYGVGTIVAMLPVAGIVGLLLLIFTGDTVHDNDPTDDDLSAGIALIFGLIASGGFWLISLGSGAAYGVSSDESGPGGGDSSELHHLAHYAEDTPGLWAAPVVMLVVLFLAAFAVARKTAAPQRILGNLGVFVALLLVALPLMSRVTSAHAGLSLEEEDYRGSYFLGQVGWQATLLLTLFALVCAGLVALMSRALDASTLRAQASALAGRMQSDPGRQAGPPPAWQPGGPQAQHPQAQHPQAPHPQAQHPHQGWEPQQQPAQQGWQPATPPPPPPAPGGAPWPQPHGNPQPPRQPTWPPADAGADDGRTRIRPITPPPGQE